MHEGIRASSSIPGVIQPMMHGGRALVDGGILNPIPANYLAALGVDVSIAVDVMPVLKPSPEQLESPSIVSTLINSFDIMGRLVAAPVTCMATVVIRPKWVSIRRRVLACAGVDHRGVPGGRSGRTCHPESARKKQDLSMSLSRTCLRPTMLW